MTINIFEQNANAEKQARQTKAPVVPIPTRYNADKLAEKGKVIVHRPTQSNGDDLPPEAA